jgi:hypothetical protein
MIELSRPQHDVLLSSARFRVLVAGRRFGKTYLSQVELCKAAWQRGRLAWYVAPTYKQAKRIIWKPLKEMTRPYWAQKPNETDLRIELVGGGTIALRGADNYDSLRGEGLDFAVLDEYASMDPKAWTEVIRPALADRKGRALFIGTPKGYDHFYELHQSARLQADWNAFQFTTLDGGIVSADEVEGATRELDERTFRQEFEASFENVTAGRVYFAFDRLKHVRAQTYDPRSPLFWSLDFNVGLMCSVIGQRLGDQVNILDEIILPDSNTWEACKVFADRVQKILPNVYPLPQIRIYGDATGEAPDSAASRTDWRIVRESLGEHANRFTTSFQVPSSNPPLKDRINCVNARLTNHAGATNLRVDPKCKHLIEDLERVHWKSDANRNALSELDKSEPKRTHVSDALGYMVAKEFPMRSLGGLRPGMMQ